jgi:hypothetical protein
MRSGDNLRLVPLAEYILYSVRMSSKAMYLSLCSHIPHSSSSITATSNKDIKLWMKCKTINATQMPMVVPDYFVLLEIPTEDLFVFSTREEVGVTTGYSQASNSVYVTCKGDFELTLN